MNHIWVYWEDVSGKSRPPYLDLCLETVKRQAGMAEVHVLDERSVFEWLPGLSSEVWTRLGTPVRRSDYARLRLLDVHGGLWLDLDCIAARPLTHLLNLLRHGDAFAWGDGKPFNNLLLARPGSDFLAHWIAAQDAVLSHTANWSALPWAALGRDISSSGAATVLRIPRSQVAPVMWYEWRRLLSRLQSPERVLASDPYVVMLWNSAMSQVAQYSAEQLLAGDMLLSRLFRLALGQTTVADERPPAGLSRLDDLRFSRPARTIAHRRRRDRCRG